jgi:SAM-dependent methyltransferase
VTDDKFAMFTERYRSGDLPWDTNITPPEIVAVVAELPPGRAIDLGCGTGTNVRYLLEHGWEADGVDYVPEAVERARHKLAGFSPERCALFCHDVTRLDQLGGLRAPYDLAIDIGCGQGIAPAFQARYAQIVAGLLRPGGTFMLYAHCPVEEAGFGWLAEEVHRLFEPSFTLIWEAFNADSASGHPAGWYRFARRG